MYLEFYGLSERPFNVTADPYFFFLSSRHKEAFSHLVYGINERKGILSITGEIGTGKTTLCRVLLNHLGNKIKTAFVLNPNLSELQLLQFIVEDFGIALDKKNRLQFILGLNNFLLRETLRGFNVALIIDEAQNLKLNQLELVRLLSNFETEKDKLLQIVLVGQPELNRKLQLPQLAQLNQRISVRYHIMPLEKNELIEYINHRLKVAGSDGRIKFSQEALDLIFKYSMGIPRIINIICDRALLAGFVKEAVNITGDIVKKCIEELSLKGPKTQ